MEKTSGRQPEGGGPTAVDGHTAGDRESTGQAVVVEQLVALVREAAGLLGHATCFWAQTVNYDCSRLKAGNGPG